MRKRFGVWASLFAIALILGIPSTGRPDGEEPPSAEANENLLGPALVGTLTLTQAGTDLTIAFAGWTCKGHVGDPLVMSGAGSIATLQADDLLDRRADGVDAVNASVPGCYPRTTTGQLIVTTVLSFSKSTDNTTAVAQVVIMAVGLRL